MSHPSKALIDTAIAGDKRAIAKLMTACSGDMGRNTRQSARDAPRKAGLIVDGWRQLVQRLSLDLRPGPFAGRHAKAHGRLPAPRTLRFALIHALAELPQAEREAMILKDVLGLSAEDLRARLHLSAEDANIRLQLARRDLRAALAVHGQDNAPLGQLVQHLGQV